MDMIYSVLPRPPETVGRGVRKDGVRKTHRRPKTRRSADGKDEYAETSTSFLGAQKLIEPKLYYFCMTKYSDTYIRQQPSET